MAADAQATLPALIEEVRRLVTDDRRRFFDERGAAIAAAHAERRRRDIRNARYGWDASPVSLARIAAELWPLIKDEDWSFSSPQGFIGGWPSRLWDMKRSYHSIGSHGGGGMGYALPASVGAALANREHGRITININGDGDLNYARPAPARVRRPRRIPRRFRVTPTTERSSSGTTPATAATATPERPAGDRG